MPDKLKNVFTAMDPLQKVELTSTVQDHIHKHLEGNYAPSAVRLFAQTILGTRDKITEADFTDDEIQLLRDAVKRAEAKGQNVIGYGDYGEKEPWADGTRSILNAFSDPGASMAYTLGTARFKRKDGEIVISDSYDFNATPERVKKELEKRGIIGSVMHGLAVNGLLGAGNVIGNIVVPEGTGRPVQIRMRAE